MRKAHIIPAVSGVMSEKDLLFFDTETETSLETKDFYEQTLKLLCYSFVRLDVRQVARKEQQGTLRSGEEFAEKITQLNRVSRPLHIISCNIWFDIRVSNLIQNLVLQGYIVSSFHVSGLCVILKMKKEKKSLIFLNINQFIAGSVEGYGKILGLEKIKIDLKNCTNEEIETYCKRDTEIIKEIFLYYIRFIAENDMGKMMFTLASQAFTCYRKKYMHENIYCHDNQKATTVERESYYGGRTEIFWKGEVKSGEITCLDVHSMYPSVMKTEFFPCKLIAIQGETTTKKLHKLLKKYYIIARVALCTTENAYPMRRDGKLIFPIGKFVTLLHQAEIEYALENNHVVFIHEIYVYNKAKIFSNFVRDLYQIRQDYKRENNNVMQHLTKILMNSLYGKFGQKNDELCLEEPADSNIYESNILIDGETNISYKEIFFGGLHKISREDVEESQHSFPAVAGAVTSYARIKLYKLMKKAGKENVFYCDTDSIFVNDLGKKKLENDIKENELGFLGVQGKSNKFLINAPKDYVFGATTKIKGINKTATKIDEQSWDMLQFSSAKSDMRQGLTEKYRIKKIRKTLSRTYDKGIVHENGMVSPFVLDEW